MERLVKGGALGEDGGGDPHRRCASAAMKSAMI
jgi:hypothetical protein